MSTNGDNTTAELARFKEELIKEVVGEVSEEVVGEVTEEVKDVMGPSLEPMTPHEAVEKYLDRDDIRADTYWTHKSSLQNHFVPWCEKNGIDNLNDLTGRDISDYREWRREEGANVDKLRPKSDQSQQKILRVFLKYCEKIEAVRPGFREVVVIPGLDKDDEVREEKIESDTAKEILAWLDKYEYGGREHVVWLLFTECGARLGGVHSLDLGDYVRDGDDGSYLKFRHRPNSGTTLKNGSEGERKVHISQSVREVLDDYIEDNRVEATDEYDREPLLTTTHGRLAKTTMRNYIYAWCRPCKIGKECPEGEEPDECEAAQRKQWASKCPQSLSTHPVRKGYITDNLKAGVPKEILCGRCDLSEDVLEDHYDMRTEEEQMEARKIAMQLARDNGEDGFGR